MELSNGKVAPSDANGNVEKKSQNEEKTDWRAVYIASLVAFLGAIENTIVGISEMAYMTTIDPLTTTQFFGVATSISKGGHAVFCLVFAIWAHKTRSVRVPLIFGRLLAFSACVLYIFVEFLPYGRRYLMGFCYLLFAIASSSSIILRAYIVQVSSHNDRLRACSGFAAAQLLSVVAGPICQLIFAWIKYPGYSLLPNIRFHIYSAPVWVAASSNFISIAIIVYCLHEVMQKKTKLKKNDDDSFYSLQSLATKIREVRQKDLPWALIFLCWIEKMLSSLTLVSLQTLTTPLLMTSFGWDGNFTVQVLSGAMLLVGILAILIAVAFAVFKSVTKIPQRYLLLFSLTMFLLLYFLTYPYPIVSSTIPEYNATTKGGCNTAEYAWCEGAGTTSPWLFLPIIIGIMGIAFPLAMIALDTIYSKVLGKINQSVMQGAFIVADDVMQVCGPVYTT
ncbi:hypothetical protein WR25_00389 [Diploscapter pachys]|uniref:Major facilitator superfamily (MFS) profile domain-containing protein n=1 Tax=Diploscapter pachys TaxID=2018661 RepID=A0A2A2JYX6_9BILA|nr:hypothetical protein WR25_00389 [Diploscapter pachys]